MQISAKHLLLPFKLFINRSGANYNQVARLVDLKLMLDNRRKLPNSGKKAAPKNSILRQGLSFVVVGIFLSLMLLQTNDPYFAIFLFHTMLIVMNSITMLAEYSVSLFDPRENNTLLPLPVNGQTMGWSRVMHILIYLLVLSLGMMLPGIVFSYFKFGGIIASLFFVSVFFNTLFTLFVTVYIYLTLIKLMDGEKLKDTMMYVQVALTIIVIVAYQIIPRYFMPESGQENIIHPNWYFVFFPPAWFTSFAVIVKQPNLLNGILGAVGVAVPVASIIFISKKLFYGFNDGLIKMAGQSTGKKQAVRTKNKTSLWFTISKTVMGVTKQEYPVFKLIWRLSGRERLFKQALLPVLSYVVVIPAISIFVIGDMQNVEHRYITFLYFTIMSSSMLPTLLTIGNSKHAKWIFYSLPDVRPDKLFKAAVKVCMSKFFLPAYLIISLPLIYFKGGSAVLDIVTIFLFNCLVAFVIQYLQTPYFMFTCEKSGSQGGGAALKMFVAMFAGIGLGFLHAYLTKENVWLPVILLIGYALLLLLISKFGFAKRYNWRYVKNANNAF